MKGRSLVHSNKCNDNQFKFKIALDNLQTEYIITDESNNVNIRNSDKEDDDILLTYDQD